MGKGGGGGGGRPTESTSTSYQTNVPEYARPYVETMLGATQKQLFQTQPTEGGGTEITGFQPYRAYGGTYDEQGNMVSYDPSKSIAGFQPLQEQAQAGIAGLQMPGQFGAATQAAMMGTQAALGAGQYSPQYFGNQFRGPGMYQPGQFSMAQAQAPELQQYQMGPAQQVGTQDYTGANVGQYMSPYMQQVVDVQQQEAKRQADILGTQLAGQATQAGAFGGSRYGLQEAERQRNLATQLGQIQATGSQAAFQNAQQQFNAQQQANMQAALANQAAGLTVGQQNLGAQLGIQQLGAGQNLQAQLANQQMLQAAQQAAEQSRQYGYGQQMTAAQQRAQYGLAGQQLGEQSRQFGANIGLQGAQAGLQGAGTLAGIGQQQLGAQQGILGLQAQTGAQQQALEQQRINQAVQDYANTQQYPLMQLGFMSNMLRGLPMQSVATQQYVAQPNYLTQGIGALGAGANIYNAMKAKGGVIKEMAKGGLASVPRYDVGGEVYSDLMDMDIDQLKQEIKESPSQRIKQMAKGILAEKMTQHMYGGGIVAFNGGGEADERTAGEAEAMQDMQARQAQSPEGILGVQTPTPPPPPGSAVAGATNIPPVLRGIHAEATRQAQMPISDIVAERKAALTAAGIPDMAEGRMEQRANLMAERANAKDEAERQRSLRLAQFFAQWGSTPGPTLVAGLNAFGKHAEGIISDEKEFKKFKRDLDKSIADIDQADRLEKIGEIDNAMKLKTDAKKEVQRLNEKVFDLQQQQMREEATAKREAAREEATAKRDLDKDVRYAALQKDLEKMRNDSAMAVKKLEVEFRKGQKAESLFNAAVGVQANVEAKIANISKNPEYLEAVRFANMDPKGQPPNIQKMIANGKEKLEGFNKSFNEMRRNADEAVERARARVDGAEYPPSTSSGKPKATPEPGAAPDPARINAAAKRLGLENAPTPAAAPDSTPAPAPAPAETSGRPRYGNIPQSLVDETQNKVDVLTQQLATAESQLKAAIASGNNDNITRAARVVTDLQNKRREAASNPLLTR